MSKTFLIMAGGTGGHVFPALATARQLQALGHQVFWLGSRGGMEEQLIGDSGIPLSLISITGLRGKGRLALLAAPWRLTRALLQALAVLRRVKPDCVIGMGGFASGPGGVAAWLLRKPLVIHEQNAIAGMTNRWLSRFASHTLEAYPEAFGPETVTRCTGNPVRQDLAELPVPGRRLGERTGPARLLVLGGSRGARAINQCLPHTLGSMPAAERPLVRHQSGAAELAETRAAYADQGVEAQVSPFIDDMAEAYAWADLVLCRAGALTLAELCAVGVGSLLVPYPHAVDGHQMANARYLAVREAALVLPQSDLNQSTLQQLLQELLGDRERLLSMAAAARELSRPDATERVVNYCLEAAHA
ncbi:MAG: undecaprenyldiphospho-muramoylpentapeptide beta-N-acetylglucosaminyltransferase [Halomonadaceae bacterium]|nr:MAG: undecaprenyldiphospho-muramoylpentapeptide beta-N-acetylglucosaminyltransferase [Halomonadaceae bacterium]